MIGGTTIFGNTRRCGVSISGFTGFSKRRTWQDPNSERNRMSLSTKTAGVSPFFPKQFTVGFTLKKKEVCTGLRAPAQLGVPKPRTPRPSHAHATPTPRPRHAQATHATAWRGLGRGVRGLGVACVAWAWRGRGVGVAWAWLGRGHGLGVAWAWRGCGPVWDSDCKRCVLVTKRYFEGILLYFESILLYCESILLCF